ncbi:CRISPR-associated protein Csy3 [Bacterioplanes sanyensis]|uniref:type I-F CRISPR-associated protein Csy3 n=1 Tax=Bacterioplanes sanyensis TaxID=1249553 RepID=UPI0019CC6E81|nr:type I-F CRISPR-associated protein Csy3 [Bacterioplanes sanyensis]GGY57560.1 CRISPR-associated protein Csy3 [Bacterioplanes sanyensis]
MANLKTAAVLAFERKLANSDGLMYAGNWDQQDKPEAWLPVQIKEKAVRGTISNRQKNAIKSDPAKLDQEVKKPNLQQVDVAALPFTADTLKLTFTLRVLGNLAEPSACDNSDYQAALASTIKGYIEQTGFTELAMRYATNLANGRFLWRNRVGAEEICVKVTAHHHTNSQHWQFDSQEFNLRQFDSNSAVQELADVIRMGLLGETYSFLTVEAFAKLGAGQEVFPSQELVMDGKKDKSKILYQVSDVAAMHSQKIGNAIRTIDTWYPQADEFGPISAEPFGSVTSRGSAYRQPKAKLDFYTLLDNWVLKGEVPALEQQHYVMAILIRGGVFGEKSE